MLHILEAATAGQYESLALPARLARLRLELEMEEAAPSPSGPDSLPLHPLAIGYDMIQSLDADRSCGTFHDTKVLIDWRSLKSAETVGELVNARTRQATKVAGLFQELEKEPVEYRVLKCMPRWDTSIRETTCQLVSA